MDNIWQKEVKSLLESLNVLKENGLSGKDIRERQKKYGKNTLPEKEQTSLLSLLASQFKSLVIWVLIGAAGVAFFLGEALDSAIILGLVLLNALLGFFYEYKAEQALEKLKSQATPYARVRRNGEQVQVPLEELVPGDLVYLEAGSKIPADGRLIETTHLKTVEASLTGESLPIEKSAAPLPDKQLSVGDRKNCVFRGTDVAYGKGIFVVTHIGAKTEIGKIATLLSKQKKETTPLYNQVNRFGKKIIFLSFAIIACIFIAGLFAGLGFRMVLMTSLALGVAAVPEGLPAIMTLTLAFGMRRMAEKKALIRRLSAVETLGSTSVIFTDKTGTLTENKMEVKFLKEGEKDIPLDKSHPLTQAALLCNNATLEPKPLGEPLEVALLSFGKEHDLNQSELESTLPRIDERPFDSDRMLMSTLHKGEKGSLLLVKGAPEKVLERSKKCLLEGKETPLDSSRKQTLKSLFDQSSEKGLRLLAFAYKPVNGSKEITEKEESDLVFSGFAAFEDPPRKEAGSAIKSCKEAGITPIMVTGDHHKTAIAIAEQIGLYGGKAAPGEASEENTPWESLKKISVFSRVSPTHKITLVEKAKKGGEVVAMTGDGVNDAPAVKSADIGIAMGITGTDVTKEAADMVIQDDNFSTIIDAVLEGRTIYANIVKSITYLLSCNLGEILVIVFSLMIAAFSGQQEVFLVLLPVHLLWINLITDGFPALAFAFDLPSKEELKSPPRPKSQPLLTKRRWIVMTLFSLLLAATTLMPSFLLRESGVQTIQTACFTTLVFAELLRPFMIQKLFNTPVLKNPLMLGAIFLSFILQLALIYSPLLQPLFRTVPLTGVEWSVILSSLLLFTAIGFSGIALEKLWQKNKS